jgi:hypothetical protein
VKEADVSRFVAEDWDNPIMGRGFKPAELIGTQSADHIRASGHEPRKQAGHMTAPDRVASASKSPCAARAVHT